MILIFPISAANAFNHASYYNTFRPTTGTTAVWTQGSGCPVASCAAAACSFNKATLRRHWIATHRKVVTRYRCLKCQLTRKRRSDMIKHTSMRHGVATADFAKEEVSVNHQYQDPYPYTLEMLLGAKPEEALPYESNLRA
ncbi:hypothetical protein PoB_004010900 [Plakobranchus ocellatus]|uniref:C2H2-type domain-containing protein n=1 Tax=Plakobranchus ocellatus TaxID=259542 RepID=A0AAV4B5F2_9GAST|nr:hypothetical protein PoB_004010900 [Plakobranchus ocellatus]